MGLPLKTVNAGRTRKPGLSAILEFLPCFRMDEAAGSPFNQPVSVAQFIARFQRIQWLQPSVIALLIANLAPLVAVFVFHWDVFSILFLFWLENVIVGVVNIFKMLLAGTGAKDLPPYGSAVFWVIKLFLIPFFCVHYGLFTYVHGLFIVGIFDPAAHHAFGLSFPLIFQVIHDHHLEWPFAGLVVSHLISFGYDYLWSGEFRHTNPLELMTQPYRRVLVMHVGVILGALLIVALHQPEIGLVLLVALKTTFDLWSHQQEREKFSSSKNFALPFTRSPLSPALHDSMQARLQAGTSRGIPARPVIVIAIFFIFCAGFIGFVTYDFVSIIFTHPRPAHSTPPPAIATTPVPWSSPEWKPKLDGVAFPETPAYGKLRGAGFSVAFAVYADQKLILSDGDGPGSRALVIAVNQIPNRLPGAAYDVWTDKVHAAPPIEMVSRGDNSETDTSRVFTGGYALKLKFGNRVKNKIPAKIYVCLPDLDKSFVGGTLEVTIEKGKKRN